MNLSRAGNKNGSYFIQITWFWSIRDCGAMTHGASSWGTTFTQPHPPLDHLAQCPFINTCTWDRPRRTRPQDQFNLFLSLPIFFIIFDSRTRLKNIHVSNQNISLCGCLCIDKGYQYIVNIYQGTMEYFITTFRHSVKTRHQKFLRYFILSKLFYFDCVKFSSWK